MPLSEIGAYRLPPEADASLDDRMARNWAMLGRALNMQSTVVVVGNGLSRAIGYPSWFEFADEVVNQATEFLRNTADVVPRDIERLEAARRRLHGEGRLAVLATFAIGETIRVLRRHGALEEIYHQYFEKRFAPSSKKRDLDPYKPLLDLGVKRFATTNYDVEIERAILGRVPTSRDLTLSGRAHQTDDLPKMISLIQKVEYQPALASFALARIPEAPLSVFHLHGRYDSPESIVATEADYQAWYLGEGPAEQAFRQTLELLFTSNPILFVGYGLDEEDPLRILRRFGQRGPKRKEHRPIFALQPAPASGPDDAEVSYLHERYGVHMVTFRQPDNVADSRAWAEAQCDALKNLAKFRDDWRHGWQQKPRIRRVSVAVSPPQPYLHYSVKPTASSEIGSARVRSSVDELDGHCKQRARAIVVLGPGGTGKSWASLRLIERLTNDEHFAGIFFWSSYYTDDAITGVDRALEYLDRDRRSRGGRFKRLLQCLQQDTRYLLVFDGFERLLASGETPEIGHPSTQGVETFLRVISDSTNKSTVLLTSRLWPGVPYFGTPSEPAEWSRVVRLERMTTQDIAESSPFDLCSINEVSALNSLLEGHAYALALASRYLALGKGSSRTIATLSAELSSVQPARRNSKMISLLLELLTEKHGEDIVDSLERLSLFMSPISKSVMETTLTPLDTERLREVLLETQLLFQTTAGPGESQDPSFTVHPTVRSYVFQRRHGAQSDGLPNFTLPGFTAGTAIVHPGRGSSVTVVTSTADRLLKAALEARRENDREGAAAHARALFGLIRSRMESLTVPRWKDYDYYLNLCFRLVNLVRSLSSETWDHVDVDDLPLVSSKNEILYADELAWLYNDIGLASCCEGQMIDAYAMWDQGYQINRVVEEAHGGQYVVQSLLHLGHSFIELGQLGSAVHYLSESARVNHRFRDKDYEGRILGYRGLVSHLQGDAPSARKRYEEALSILEERNPRAESFFLFHLGNLEGATGDPRATETLTRSMSIAVGRDYPDLQAYARCGLGTVMRRQGRFVEAGTEYSAALEQARAMGIRRLEADLLSERSRLAFDLGDFESARRRAIESLAIANELGLGLRQTSGLYVLGLALHGAGHRAFGIDYLTQARILAAKQQYWSREREIESKIGLLGARGMISDFRSTGYARDAGDDRVL